MKLTLLETDDYQRTTRLSNIYRQILELTPFERRAKELVRDTTLFRYLVLCLPLNENVVENIFISLMFKLQNSMFFLRVMNNNIKQVLKVKESKLLTEEMNDRHNVGVGIGALEGTKAADNFQEFVEKCAPVQVVVNISRIKTRCMEYLHKLLYILEVVGGVHCQNFGELYEDRKDDKPPIDFFDTLQEAYINAGNPVFRGQVVKVYEEYKKHPMIGNNKFKGEIKFMYLCTLLLMPSEPAFS